MINDLSIMKTEIDNAIESLKKEEAQLLKTPDALLSEKEIEALGHIAYLVAAGEGFTFHLSNVAGLPDSEKGKLNQTMLEVAGKYPGQVNAFIAEMRLEIGETQLA